MRLITKTMEKYKNKYRIISTRAEWWNYTWNGAYFITICTKNRDHLMGKIKKRKMILSPTGVIADILWHTIPNYTPFVQLGDFVVMPNHIHGILILDKSRIVVETLHATSLRSQTKISSQMELRSQMKLLSKSKLQSTPESRIQTKSSKNKKMAKMSPKSGSISTIIRSYKSAVTKHANRLGLENGWQANYHDRIIRNEIEYQCISDYIISNPANWQKDKFYSL